MSGLRVVTANVNGIRAAERRGGLPWLEQADPHVICLQEVRATGDQLREVLAGSGLADYHVAHAEAPDKGRAGVAVLSRMAPSAVRDVTGVPGMDGLGRWIEAELPTDVGTVTVVSAYVHTGEADTAKQDDKYAFLEAMDARLATLRRSASRRKAHVLVCGDLNVAHREVDIKNWKGNIGKAGFLEEERAYFDRWFDGPWVDLGRHLGGDGPGPYTWWSWRGQAFDNDAGWRIDYQVASPALAGRATRAEVGRARSYAERWSDHAPLVVDFR
jgi:exodeoxyribonuclease III